VIGARTVRNERPGVALAEEAGLVAHDKGFQPFEETDEDGHNEAVTEAHAKAIQPFRQPDGSYRIKATFRCLLAQP
jgi:hypothetical protein